MGEDIDTLKANTAIATLMSLVNNFNANGCNKAELKVLLTLLCPFAPHICEEIWEQHGFEGLLQPDPVAFLRSRKDRRC